ncbi:TLC domain-containing protein [Stachybotrys elegans]|uniref:TLC domain-containing protein n=1 Tax=Stachybotrys elegans TaxID=80388 RepID=A0A8K0ST53_9HYPO|nr:TLC domain-containing protein [Stachybotrys elegans]
MGDSSHAASSPADERSTAKPSSARPQPAASSSTSAAKHLYTRSSGNVVIVRRLKRKDEGTWKPLARWLLKNQIGLSFNLLALLFLAHMFIPKARTHTRKYFTLSYYNQRTGQYGIGPDDAFLITFFVILFTGLRASIMDFILSPLGRKAGITKQKLLTRFSEQAWLTVYYSVFWTLGAYIWYDSPYFPMNLPELWTDWPNREMKGLMKFYMVAQWSFWVQQIIVLFIEERRKDHWQMFCHHIITNALVSACYCYHYTRVGNVILVMMDVVDLFFPTAKCLKYTGYHTLCDIMFGLFVVTWIIARHVGYVMVCWSIYADTPNIMPAACFQGTNDNLVGPLEPPAGWTYLLEPFYKLGGNVCYNEKVKWGFLVPLLLLQAITILWFTMIVRVVIKVLRGDSAEDVRSDDEDEVEEADEVEEDFVYEEAQPLEEEVGVESLDLKGWERRSGLKRQASSSGVSLPGHSDRKELLGRIGCEKQVD